MKDPYEVLGIGRNATDEQVKDAYRNLARKYHPDNYGDNPLSDLAQEKMKEINEAYDSIMNERKNGSSNRKNGGSYQSSGPSAFPEVRSLINQGRLEQAQELLDGVPPQSRNAEWYFLNGTVLYRRGWFDQAYTSFVTASRMDPYNTEYQNAVRNAQRQSAGQYNNPYRSYGGASSCTGCDVCQGLICADCCCECMGGDLIRCC
ncbi:MAG: DnaJ domain-containing protein [Clostridia bacterium]|nr:DnaJ domain-containing protein [Clostridia bacterium]